MILSYHDSVLPTFADMQVNAYGHPAHNVPISLEILVPSRGAGSAATDNFGIHPGDRLAG